MNRIQFFTLVGLASLLVVLMVSDFLLARSVATLTTQLSQAQQSLQQGQAIQQNLNILARRLYSDAQKTSDPGLKDLITRQQIVFHPDGATNSTETPAAPTTTK